MTSQRHSRAGFTLIELLLVLVIVATLAALVAPSFVGRGTQAKVDSAKAQIDHFESMLRLFEADYGRYPTTEEGLDALLDPPALPDGKENDTVYLEKDHIPKDPWGNAFVYECPGTHNTRFADISSPGPDGRSETDDDIRNWESSKE